MCLFAAIVDITSVRPETLSDMSVSGAVPRLVIASRNRKKAAEIRELLAPHGIEVLGVADFPNVPEVVEDGGTFAANAAKKAAETARAVSHWTLGEDSGLEVAALAGAPGIYSKPASADPEATSESNNAKLLSELAAVPEERRSARYVCNAALADPSGQIVLQVEAYCRGHATCRRPGKQRLRLRSVLLDSRISPHVRRWSPR